MPEPIRPAPITVTTLTDDWTVDAILLNSFEANIVAELDQRRSERRYVLYKHLLIRDLLTGTSKICERMVVPVPVCLQ